VSYSLENLRSKESTSLEHAVSDKAVAKHVYCNNWVIFVSPEKIKIDLKVGVAHLQEIFQVFN